MALRKTIKQKNGIIGSYHRITTVLLDEPAVEVTVRTYASKQYRDSEKLEIAQDKQIRDYSEELDSLVLAPTEANEPRRVELSSLVNEAYENGYTAGKTDTYHICDNIISLTVTDENYTKANLYALLKLSDEFADAVDE